MYLYIALRYFLQGDNAAFSYSLRGGEGRFIVDPHTGVIAVNGTLDREKQENFSFLVRTICYNDNIHFPMFWIGCSDRHLDGILTVSLSVSHCCVQLQYVTRVYIQEEVGYLMSPTDPENLTLYFMYCLKKEQESTIRFKTSKQTKRFQTW